MFEFLFLLSFRALQLKAPESNSRKHKPECFASQVEILDKVEQFYILFPGLVHPCEHHMNSHPRDTTLTKTAPKIRSTYFPCWLMVSCLMQRFASESTPLLGHTMQTQRQVPPRRELFETNPHAQILVLTSLHHEPHGATESRSPKLRS